MEVKGNTPKSTIKYSTENIHTHLNGKISPFKLLCMEIGIHLFLVLGVPPFTYPFGCNSNAADT